MSTELLRLKGISKRFGNKYALKDIDLEIEEGRIVGLLGPNGSGKTTMMKLINGLLSPDSGEITVRGEHPGPYTKSVVSYLPDRAYIADWMKVKDLLRMFSDFYRDFNTEKALNMLSSLGISENERIKNMSKGNKEKVQLIMVMSREASLYLLDEPIGGVDPAARDFILKTIITNYSENATVIISTHLISDVEKILDEAIFLKEGKIVRRENVDDIRDREGRSVDQLFREEFSVSVPADKEAL